MGIIAILAGIGTVAGLSYGLFSRDEAGMVILKTLAGFIAGFLFGVLLIVTVLRGLDT